MQGKNIVLTADAKQADGYADLTYEMLSCMIANTKFINISRTSFISIAFELIAIYRC
jgi:hypothetical protein